MRLAASQVIERPPAEVFRFVATDHFQNHPKWDPAVTSITKTSPGPMGVGTTARLVRTDRGRRVEGSMEVTEYEPVRSFGQAASAGGAAQAPASDPQQVPSGDEQGAPEPGRPQSPPPAQSGDGSQDWDENAGQGAVTPSAANDVQQSAGADSKGVTSPAGG